MEPRSEWVSITAHRVPVCRFAKIPEDEAFMSEEERSSSESESDHSEEEREQKLLVLQNQVRRRRDGRRALV